jgi:GGDEF domain-containing protein
MQHHPGRLVLQHGARRFRDNVGEDGSHLGEECFLLIVQHQPR